MSGHISQGTSCIFSGLNLNTKKFLEFLDEKADLIFTCQKLDVSENEMVEFNLNLQDSSIKILLLQKNKIETLKLNITSLIELNVSNNKIYEIPNFNFLVNLEYLYLSKNNIQKFETDKFARLKNLKFFDINDNLIKFDSVSEFKNSVESMANNLKNLLSFVIDNNPFCHDEIFTQYYAYYISALFCSKPNYSLRELNRMKVKKKESENVNSVYAVLIDRERKNKERNEKTFNILDSILEKFMLHENFIKEKLPEFKKLILDYIERETFDKTDFNIRLSEIELKDEDSIAFEKMTSKLCIFIEKYDYLDNFIIKSYLNFSTIKKGKWADIALSFLHHFVKNNNKHKELDEHLINHFEKFLLDENVSVEEKTLDNIDENDQKQKISIASNPILLKGFKHFASHEYENFIKNLYITIMEKILSNPKEIIDFCKRKFKEKIPKAKKNNETIQQYYIEDYFSFSSEKSMTRFYGLEIISLCFKSDNFKKIKYMIKGEHYSTLALLTLIFWNNYYERNYHNKNLNIQFLKLLVTFTKIFKVIIKNGIELKKYQNKNIQTYSNLTNENKIDFESPREELKIEKKFINNIFSLLETFLKDNKVGHSHINPNNPIEFIFLVSELSKHRNFVVTNSILENDTKTLEMNAYDNIFIAQLIKISTLLVFLFEEKNLFKRIEEKIEIFLTVKDEEYEVRKIEDKFREEEKNHYNILPYTEEKYKFAYENNYDRKITNQNADYNYDQYDFNYPRLPNQSNKKSEIQNPKEYLNLIKKKLKDDVLNYDLIENNFTEESFNIYNLDVIQEENSIEKITDEKNSIDSNDRKMKKKDIKILRELEENERNNYGNKFRN